MPSADAADATQRVRLWGLVCRLETLTGRTDPLSTYVRGKLVREQQRLLDWWPQGRWILPDLESQARQPLPDASPSNDGPLALKYSYAEPTLQTLDLYRVEFEKSWADSHTALVDLQRAALEVVAQRKAAREEREGFSFHEATSRP